jgi:hypothetical protein
LKILVFGGTGVLGGKVVEALSKKFYCDIFVIGRKNCPELEVLTSVKLFRFDLSKPENYRELLEQLDSSEIVNVVWAVSPSIKVGSQKSWISTVDIDCRELELFKVFCSFVMQGNIQVGSMVVVSSEAALRASKRRGIWAYAAGKILIQILAEELFSAKKFTHLKFIFPGVFMSKCSDEIRRLMQLRCDSNEIDGYVNEILDHLPLSS